MRFPLALLALLVAGLGMAGASGADELGGRWAIRPLIVFAPDASAGAAQTGLLDAPEQLRDLKLAVYVVTPDVVSPWFGAPRPATGAGALRQRYGVGASEFRVVLIGLDGAAKLTAAAPVTLEQLAATIDEMPMRRRELSGGDG